jgi:aspartate/methionine/tyrosine aminotransferase
MATKGRTRLARRVEGITPFRVVEVMEQAWRVEASGRDVIHLVAGEPDFGTPVPVVEAAARAMEGGHLHYTPTLGVPELRDALVAYYAERLGVDVPRRRVVVTTGASAALLLAFGATVDPGAEVLVTDPGYPCNSNLVKLYGGVPVGVPVDADTGYQPALRSLEEARTDATAGVLIGTPSNPTGAVTPSDALAGILRWAAGAGLACYVDEVYGELVYDRAPATALAASDDIFVIGSFSKTFGMTGWRLGWLVCPEWATHAVKRLAQNMYISPPTPAQAAGLAALQPAGWEEVARRVEVLRRRRDVIVDGLDSVGFRVPVVPEGAFYAYADCSRLCEDSSELVHRLLHDAGVAVAPGNDFGSHRAAQHVRFSYAASLDQIEAALDRMARVAVRS